MESQEATGVEVRGAVSEEFAKILTPEALKFVKLLHGQVKGQRDVLLQRRKERQQAFDSGALPGFSPGRKVLWDVNWRVAFAPGDLRDRRVEITGPAGDRKMVINALNSGANVFMADFEDALSPTWEQVSQGQVNLRDAVDNSIKYESPEGKAYSLNEKTATLIVRPRGLHLLEEHVIIDGQAVSASVFDVAIFLHENAKKLRAKGSNPYFYIPKMESAAEGRFWNKLFAKSEEFLVMPSHSIRVTALIETLPAVFEMDDILYSLKEYIVGLNCGRWDYMFSYIKTLRNHPQFVLPDRAQLTMDKGFLAPYVDLLVKTCHKRGAYAIGGMSAFIPVKNDEAANDAAFRKVRADKEREVKAGHDGTWVAHPALVSVAKEVFDKGMPGRNQLSVMRDEVDPTRDDLLKVPEGTITESGLKTNVSVGLQYLAAWLGGTGAVPINNQMEDTATAEISRTQLWQWIKHGAKLSDGKVVAKEMVKPMVSAEVERLASGATGEDEARIKKAGEIFESLVLADKLEDFLTTPAYEALLRSETKQ